MCCKALILTCIVHQGDFLDIGQAEQSVLRELANRLADDILSDSAAAIVRLLERKESRLH
jgi:hypothetical protein